ncbi:MULTISPECIES: hypothetical protein [Alcaligenaceae]|uniref:hypothetical protein n=1 Tax=Bordetella genomosp. 10 TaxID=1416804 RepID=UPI00211AFD66|nr:hypothetical protein [Bordetella genomosp. 10]
MPGAAPPRTYGDGGGVVLYNGKVGNQRLDRFWRKFYSAMRSRRMQHNRHLWPYVSIKRDATGAISAFKAFRHSVPLTPISEAFSAPHELVHLILSGPSIGEIQYDRLPIETAMGVNGSIALVHKFDIPFKYYCVIDQNFVRRRIDLMREVVSRDLTLFVTPDVLRYLMQGIPPATYKCRICVIEVVSERAYQPSSTPQELLALAQAGPEMSVFDAERALGFSFNVARGVFDADTVAYAALQVMVAGGVKKMYIHGLDLGFSSGRRFYDEGARPETSRLVRNFERMIEPSFAHAAHLLQARGVELYNLSLDSALSDRIIPKVNWRTLLSPPEA